MKKLIALFSAICVLGLVGCENSSNTSDPSYTFSDTIIVGSISDPITGVKGDLAQIDSVTNNYIVIVCDGVHLQRLGSNQVGYVDIPTEQFTIIRPGDELQFAYDKDQINYNGLPPVVRPSTIRIMK